MKHLMVSILVLLSTVTKAQYAPVGTRWDFSFMSGPWQNIANNPIYRHYPRYLVIEKDTLIQGKIFSKIIGNAPGPNFLRQENRKVFYLFDGKECLLIDFNAQKEDTLTLDILIQGTNMDLNTFQVLKHKMAIVDTVYYIPNESQNDSLKTIGFHFNIDSSEMAQTYHENPFHYHFTEKFLTSLIYYNSYFLGERVNLIFPSGSLHDLRCFTTTGYKFTSSWWQTYWVEPFNFPCDYEQTYLSSKTNFGSEITFRCYPNPVNDKLTIETSFDECILSIYSIAGQKLLEIFYPYAGKNELQLEIPSGVYLLKVKTKTGFIFHYKLVKN